MSAHIVSRVPSPGRRLLAPALLGLVVLGQGCMGYPDADDRVTEEIIYTRFDSDADFTSYQTFAVSTDVVVFSEDDGEIEQELLEEALANPIIEKVTAEMKARGYTQVAMTEDPDLGVTLSLLDGEVTGYYSYWTDYWGYPGYYYYYPYTVTYSYETGALLIDLADLKSIEPPPMPMDVGDFAITWLAAIYGVKVDSQVENVERALDGIDQAFEQSPYLKGE